VLLFNFGLFLCKSPFSSGRWRHILAKKMMIPMPCPALHCLAPRTVQGVKRKLSAAMYVYVLRRSEIIQKWGQDEVAVQTADPDHRGNPSDPTGHHQKFISFTAKWLDHDLSLQAPQPPLPTLKKIQQAASSCC
jgi:hypothetical protein